MKSLDKMRKICIIVTKNKRHGTDKGKHTLLSAWENNRIHKAHRNRAAYKLSLLFGALFCVNGGGSLVGKR